MRDLTQRSLMNIGRLRQLVQLFTSFLTFITVCSSHEISPKHTSPGSWQRQEVLEGAMEKCTSNLLAATSEDSYMFTQEAYLDFIRIQSNGAIDKNAFDSSIMVLAHEYWVVTCSILKDDCVGGGPVTVYDVLEYVDKEDGSDLVTRFCSRVNVELERLISAAPSPHPSQSNVPTMVPSPIESVEPSAYPTVTNVPTRSPTLSPTISVLPTSSPSSSPTLSPSASPTISSMPTNYPSVSPTRSLLPTEHPSIQPSVAPTESSSVRPTLSGRPTQTVSASPSSSPTTRVSFTLTFSVGYDVDNPAALITDWGTDIVYSKLEQFDPRCTVSNAECPILTDIRTLLIPRDCSIFVPPIMARECALADISVSISSSDYFDETILDDIELSIRTSVNELEDILRP